MNIQFSKFKIGLRTVKTALAVGICLLIYYLYGTETGLYSCIAAIVCMRESVDKSWQMGLHRFLGSLIGGILGYLLVTAAQYMPYYQDGLYVIILPLGMIACIWLCTLIDKKNGVIICCVVFISIGLAPHMNQADTLRNVILRMTDTTVGIVVAALVNRFFFPYYKGGAETAGEKIQTLAEEHVNGEPIERERPEAGHGDESVKRADETERAVKKKALR